MITYKEATYNHAQWVESTESLIYISRYEIISKFSTEYIPNAISTSSIGNTQGGQAVREIIIS
jgi:hypothetical protein